MAATKSKSGKKKVKLKVKDLKVTKGGSVTGGATPFGKKLIK